MGDGQTGIAESFNYYPWTAINSDLDFDRYVMWIVKVEQKLC